MWTVAANRKCLLDLVSSKNPFSNLDIQRKERVSPDLLGNKELLLIWREKPRVGSFIPEMIWVTEGKIYDFLAWVSTYLSSFRPFTAYCRVLDSGRIGDSLPKRKEASLKHIEGAAIAVTIGEAITHYENRDFKRVTPIAIMSTYSFAIARSYSLGLVREGYNPAIEKWQKAHKLTRQPNRALDAKEIDKIWKTLILLDSGKGIKKVESVYPYSLVGIVEACRELRTKGEIGPKKWHSLTRDWPKLENVAARMKDRREDRVVWFEEYLQEIQNLPDLDRTSAAFVCGYLASQIAPGSIQHIGLLRPYVKRFPSVILWYSLCAGLYPKTDVYNYDRGLGRRVLRDLLRREGVYEKPTGDIAVEELEVLLDVERPDKDFRAASHSHLIVEILPCVYTVVIWPGESGTIELESARTREKKKRANKLLVELGEILSRAQDLQKSVVKTYWEGGQVPSSERERGVNSKTGETRVPRRKEGIHKKGKQDLREHPMLDLKE